jgi:F-type H+-transporting ATPase subunit a
MGHPVSIYDLLADTIPVAVQAVAAGALLLLLLSWYVWRDISKSDSVIPDGRLTLRSFIELIFEGISSLARDIIGEHWAKHMPLIGTMGLFILISNVMGLVPGLGGSTQFIETNGSWAVIAVISAEIVGIRAHGVAGWLGHFNPGPIWIAPLLFPVEVISHLVRIMSLTIRLTANMFADHTMVGIFLSFGVVAYFVPWALLGLGLFVAFVQAFIFTFLGMVYIGQALEEAH